MGNNGNVIHLSQKIISFGIDNISTIKIKGNLHISWVNVYQNYNDILPILQMFESTVIFLVLNASE